MTCIYCQSDGPYSDEHVVSAGLGGDDKDWLLKDCVCRACNTGIFSPLEQMFLRSSGAALARLFLQPKTRNRGTKTGTPSIQAALSYYHDPQTGLLLEQELKSGGAPTILAQIILLPPSQFSIAGPDILAVNAFWKELSRTLSDAFPIVEKVREGYEARYQVHRMSWKDQAYEVEGPTSSEQPPKGDRIWLEPLSRAGTAQGGVLTPRVYQRSGGQPCCRARDIEQAAGTLTLLRLNRDKIAIPDKATPSVDPAPNVHLRLGVEPAAHDRVLAKTGVNMCAHLFGPDLVRRAEFERVREYARTGQGAIMMLRGAQAEKFKTDLLPELQGFHLFALALGPASAAGNYGLVFLSRLYGGPVEGIRLAEFGAGAPTMEPRVFVVVDYESHAISRLSLEQYGIFLSSHGIVA